MIFFRCRTFQMVVEVAQLGILTITMEEVGSSLAYRGGKLSTSGFIKSHFKIDIPNLLPAWR